MRKRTILTAFVASALMTGSALAQTSYIFRYKGNPQSAAFTPPGPPPTPPPALQFGTMSIEYFDGGGNGNRIAEPLNFDVEGVTAAVPITNRGDESVHYKIDWELQVGSDKVTGFCAETLNAKSVADCGLSLAFSDFPTIAQRMLNRPGEDVAFEISINFIGLEIGGEKTIIPVQHRQNSEVHTVRVAEASPSDLYASTPILGVNLDHDGGSFSTDEAGSRIVIDNLAFLGEVARNFQAAIDLGDLGRAPLLCDTHTLTNEYSSTECSAELALTGVQHAEVYARYANGNHDYTTVNLGYDIVLTEMNGKPHSHTISSHPTGFFLVIGPLTGV